MVFKKNYDGSERKRSDAMDYSMCIWLIECLRRFSDLQAVTPFYRHPEWKMK